MEREHQDSWVSSSQDIFGNAFSSIQGRKGGMTAHLMSLLSNVDSSDKKKSFLKQKINAAKLTYLSSAKGFPMTALRKNSSMKKRKKDFNEQFPWAKDLDDLCRVCTGTSNIDDLVQLVEFFNGLVKKDVEDSYSKPNKAAKVSAIIGNMLKFIHSTFKTIVMVIMTPFQKIKVTLRPRGDSSTARTTLEYFINKSSASLLSTRSIKIAHKFDKVLSAGLGLGLTVQCTLIINKA